MPNRQRRRALVRANEVRTDRGVTRQKIKQGYDPRPYLLEEPTRHCLEGVPLMNFLTWIPWIGKGKARAMVRTLNPDVAALGVQIADVSRGDRERVVDALSTWYAGREQPREAA